MTVSPSPAPVPVVPVAERTEPVMDAEEPCEIPSLRFRKMDLAVIACSFATEVAGAFSGLLSNLTFCVSAHRNWQIDRDREAVSASQVPIIRTE